MLYFICVPPLVYLAAYGAGDMIAVLVATLLLTTGQIAVTWRRNGKPPNVQLAGYAT